MRTRKAYPADATDEEWTLVAPYLTLLPPEAPQRNHDLWEVFNALRWLVRAGAPWRMLPDDFPPWAAVYQQTQRLGRGGLFRRDVELPRLCGQVNARRLAPPVLRA